MEDKKQQTSVRNKAMDLLARRELREFDSDEITAAIDSLQRDNLLSDERFTESYVSQRFNAGFGPLKIRYELRQKGISESLTDEFLEAYADRWDRLMQQQRVRKYGEAIPADYNQRMKQARFLQNRGFSPESVMRLFR
ncbi:MAG: hypothetical protein GWP56_19145 [Gammaproteobacteria bacterium]|nr:hypothetical protein [Gammaproteobacteria bacterium]